MKSFDSFEPIAAEMEEKSPLLVWQDLALTQEAYPVLVGASGSIESGEVMAVLGSGSSTDQCALMDLLSGRRVDGEVEGYVALEGRPCRRDKLRDVSALVPYGAAFPSHLTAVEAVFFRLRLRVGAGEPNGEVMELSRWALGEMELGECVNHFVGGPLDGGALHVRGLTVDQRRRLAIAAAVAEKPRILYLEFPTSGLDCKSALVAMSLVAEVALSATWGMAVVAAVHKPRRALWHLFDSCYFLSEGHVMYAGPCDGALSWFQSIGYLDGAGDAGTPSDLILDLIAIDCDKDPRCYGTSTMVYLTDVANASRAFQKARGCAIRDVVGRTKGRAPFDDRYDENAGPAIQVQFVAVLCRTFRLHLRHPKSFSARLGYMLAAVALGAFLFGHEKKDDLAPWETAPHRQPADGGPSYERVTAFTHACVVWVVTVFMAELAACGTTFHDRLRATRDFADGLYGPGVFFAAYALLEVVFGCLIFYPTSLLFAYAAHLEAAAHFARVMTATGIFFKLSFFTACCVCEKLDVAANGVMVVGVFAVCCSNTVVRRRDLPGAAAWLPYFSILRPALAMLVRGELGSSVVAYMGLGEEMTNDGDALVLAFYTAGVSALGYYWLAYRRRPAKRAKPEPEHVTETPFPHDSSAKLSPREIQIERILAAYEAALLKRGVGFPEIEELRHRTGVCQDEFEGVVSPTKRAPFAAGPSRRLQDAETPTTRRRKISKLLHMPPADFSPDALADFAKTYARADHLAVEVRYREIRYGALVDATAPRIRNVLSETPMGMIARQVLFKGERTRRVDILKGVSGVLRPATMTLVLGKPGSGKTSFLKLLCGALGSSEIKGLSLEGRCFYNGEDVKLSKRFVPSKVSAYIDEVDLHSPSLTVEDTLEFAFETLGAGAVSGESREDMLRNMRGGDIADIKSFIKYQKEGKMKLKTVLGLLGLTHVKGTIVGNAQTRGISGGQRRRVSVGEILMGKARVLCGDEITTGLDSQTAFEIVKAFKAFARDLKTTIVLSLLQPPPEVFALFDEVVLLDAGRVLYHGPRQQIMGHFAAIGFRPPARKDAADFLIEVSSPAGYAYRDGRPGPPTNADDFAALFRQTERYGRLVDALDAPHRYEIPANERWPDYFRIEFTKPTRFYVYWCLRRRCFEIAKNPTYVKVRILESVVLGLVTGLLFKDLAYEDFPSKMGMLFVVLMYLGVTGMAQMPELLERRDLFYKHRGQSFIPTVAFVVANVAVDFPVAIIEGTIFTNITYWFVGMDAEGYPIFFLLCLGMAMMMRSIFAFVASISVDVEVANPLAGAITVGFTLFSGFIVQKPNIPWYWSWLYYVSPITYGIQAAGINEFTATKYQGCKFQKAVGCWWYWDWRDFRWERYKEGCCFAPSDGKLFLGMYKYKSDRKWIAVAFYVYAVYFVLGMVLQVLALSYVRFNDGHSTAAQVEAPPEKAAPQVAVAVGHAVKGLDVIPEEDEHGRPRATSVASEESSSLIGVATPRRRSLRGELRRTSRKQSAFSDAPAMEDIDMDGDVPYERMTVAFRDLHYFVDVPPRKSGDRRGHLELLGGVTGFALPAKMTALMGQTGSGKTTLLDVIAGRKNGGSLSGLITVNGHAKKQATFARISGYVEQLDVHSPGPTVAEAVAFSAALRLNANVSDDKRSAFCANILAILELGPIAGNQVGTLGRSGGLSFEQRKRLTIAVELAANPALFFLDEPTSGLDSRAALVVMKAVKKVAATGRSVIVTVHQPSYALFSHFDALLLLKKGGSVTFFGTLGPECGAMVGYFERVCREAVDCELEPLGDGANPATWMLGACGEAFAAAYADSELYESNLRECERWMRPEPGSQPVSFPSEYAVSTKRQREVLVNRMIINYWRGPAYNVARGGVTLLIALIFGSVFTEQRPEAIATFTGGLGRIGLLYIATFFSGVIFFTSAMPIMMDERRAFYREKHSRMYSIAPYVESFAVAEFPYLLVFSLVHTGVMWYLVDFYHSWDKYAWYFTIYFLYVSGQTFFAQFLVAAMPTVESAQSVGTAFLSICSLLAGFAIAPDKIPFYFRPLYNVAALHYAFEGMIVTQFHDSHVRIRDLPGAPTNKRYFTSHWEHSHWGGEFCYSHRWYDIIALFAYMVVFRVGTIICLSRVDYTTR